MFSEINRTESAVYLHLSSEGIEEAAWERVPMGAVLLRETDGYAAGSVPKSRFTLWFFPSDGEELPPYRDGDCVLLREDQPTERICRVAERTEYTGVTGELRHIRLRLN